MRFEDIKPGSFIKINGQLSEIASVFSADPTGGNGRHLIEGVITKGGDTHFFYIDPSLGKKSDFAPPTP